MYKIKQSPEDFIVREIMDLKTEKTGKYSYYLLTKTNLTTQAAIERIARMFHVIPKFINYAGLKDKVAITSQYISISGGPEKDLEQSDLKLEFLGKVKERISLGQLQANEFEIIVRNTEKPRPIKRIRNLFDEQRFGMKGNNHEIGRAIVKRDFKKACEMMEEHKVMKHLEEHPNEYVGALKRIPMKLLKLYIHAYQSYIWNEMAKDSEDEELPLIGFDTKIECDDVKPEEFLIREIPELSFEGTKRKVFVDIENLEIEEIDEKSVKIKFKLPKGSYATQVIKQMFKYQK